MVTGSLAVPRTTLQDTIRSEPHDRHHGSQVQQQRPFSTYKALPAYYTCISLFISDVQGNLPSLSESCEFGWFDVSLSLQARLRRRCVEERASVASCPAGQSQQQQQAPRLRNKIFGSLEYGVGHEFPRNVEGVRSWIDRQTNRPTVEETPFVQCVPVPPARPPTEYFSKLC